MIMIFQSFSVKENLIFGTYGITNTDPSGIELVINENHTFTFKDFSNPKNKINTTGTWAIKKEFIVLKSSDSNQKFHTKWKITNKGSKAKSRKGMTFYTLCKIKPTL